MQLLCKTTWSMIKDVRPRDQQLCNSFSDRDDTNATCRSDSSDECEWTAFHADTSTGSFTASQSNVRICASRHLTVNEWTVGDLCVHLSTAKRIFTKGGAISTLRKYLMKIHNKAELRSTCTSKLHSESNEFSSRSWPTTWTVHQWHCHRSLMCRRFFSVARMCCVR
jgi:hypothetical protein